MTTGESDGDTGVQPVTLALAGVVLNNLDLRLARIGVVLVRLRELADLSVKSIDAPVGGKQ